MRPKLAELFFALALIIVAGVLFTFRPDAIRREISFDAPVSESATTTENTADIETAPQVTTPQPALRPAKTAAANVPKKTIATPGPLVAPPLSTTSVPEPTPTGNDTGALKPSEIISLSNVERAKTGLPALRYSNRLTAMAEAKALDMIEKQYFAHESPSGDGVGELADKYGYEYLSVGENLALGDFASSSHVVDGWMNSPGHRANILNTEFTEIGVSAFEGKWKGDVVWFSVQEFGRPMSDCPAPDPALRARIENQDKQLDDIMAALDVLQAEVESAHGTGEYNAKARAYNTIVDEYNTIARRMKEDVVIYNFEVQLFNACIAK
jgi:uncharacterized protein YkwD